MRGIKEGHAREKAYEVCGWLNSSPYIYRNGIGERYLNFECTDFIHTIYFLKKLDNDIFGTF